MARLEKTESWLKTEITVGQLVTISATILTLLVSSWINVNGRITALEMQMQLMKEDRIDDKDFQKTILIKLEQIQLKIENKADRK